MDRQKSTTESENNGGLYPPIEFSWNPRGFHVTCGVHMEFPLKPTQI